MTPGVLSRACPGLAMVPESVRPGRPVMSMRVSAGEQIIAAFPGHCRTPGQTFFEDLP